MNFASFIKDIISIAIGEIRVENDGEGEEDEEKKDDKELKLKEE
jgi:hypothetical protein